MMIKEIISTVEKVTNAQEPTVTHKILFKEIMSTYDSNLQMESFNINSYKVIDDVEGEYEFIETHNRVIEKAELDAMRAAMTITSTDYTDVRNEEMVKGAISN